jgi:hypothetical protein
MTQMITGFFLIFLHALVAWVGIEVYVNSFHVLPRFWFVFWHYIAVFVLFSIAFSFYFRVFDHFSIFATTLLGVGSVLLIEIIVFRFFYTGELWFLNYVDWIVPVFIAASAIYLAGVVNR